ncbi:hypothetical protein, partial [Arthrobacter sp.]|uniref:hypothetical protein n=1 Tax=Arthrobacter sp. TaxID=1667 RepID=UPI002583F8E1
MEHDLRDFGKNLLVMDKQNPQLLLALRSLELPIAPNLESDAIVEITNHAIERGLSPDDLALIISEQMMKWGESGAAAKDLSDVIEIAMRYTPSVLSDVDARSYLSMYSKLRNGTGDVAGLPHAVARRLLSRTSLVAHLLREERFSCSQVARLLHATEASLDVPYGSVAVLARELKLMPLLNPYAAGDQLWDSDSELSLALFPDSTDIETTDIAATEIESWLPDVEISGLLNRLA